MFSTTCKKHRKETIIQLYNLIMDLFHSPDDHMIDSFLMRNGAIKKEDGKYHVYGCNYELHKITAFHLIVNRLLQRLE